MASSTLSGDLIYNLQVGTTLNIGVGGYVITGTLNRVGNDYLYLAPFKVPMANILYIEELP
ncbi:hypothetical protein BRE01_38380 [Brevibacillus reuszeri]|uniref:Uncharacterized protein n=1 Tax=Brevibacillus reuszeri TaxID=54915 RepID=A0A0K9YVT7_9BACL|nr:hypothetical protein [Brevibacillus reuszeri]KNB72824.1 hypothetical protein ADS79_13360 [Brevibacillus reuszeri]MED1860467.1 hypothetical protein [Brevibacillus reuszeri]GED70136.1 hypothetical protein BRE01_38380 [Brevibacillus reuszeri]